MKIGVLKEIKPDEYRVALTAEGARALTSRGHTVLVESGAGAGSGIADDDYRRAGAVVTDGDTVWADAALVLKVKEPLPGEWGKLSAGQVLFTFLHLAAAPELTRALCASGATCIAYETVTTPDHRLPLLAPMSAIAGRLAAQVGAFLLMKPGGGRGCLMGGIAGVPPARVLVLGGGTAGTQAARAARGLQADVTIVERSPARLCALAAEFGATVRLAPSTPEAIAAALPQADLVIGAALIPGARAPRLISRAQLASLRPGAVIVDIAIDQGGCCETSRPTTHGAPTFVVDGVLHYCVANMPGAVPITSTAALTNATLPCVLALADRGVAGALAADPALAGGVNVCAGHVTCPPVAAAVGLPVTPLAQLQPQLRR